ncbi:Metallo-peptidase family M12-domain-containing protein [Obelidium mucronatum]|nr:Metallo-peptidase family M12-domain-containing protein [Obelidium mucronatum]
MIMHHHESGNTVFEGSFTTPSDGLYNLKSVQTYRNSKRPIDVEIASAMSRGDIARDSRMILFHDSGVEPPFFAPKRRRQARQLSKGTDCGIKPTHSHYQSVMDARAQKVDGAEDLVLSSKLHSRDQSPVRRAGTGVAGCRGTKQFVFMGAAADCNYVSAAGGTSQALANILSDFNQASAVYEASFQVGLAIIKVNLQTACSTATAAVNGASMGWNQACVSGYSINDRLSDFSQWRGAKDGRSLDNAGLWHLMTGCTTAVSGEAVGIAWLQTLCQQRSNLQSDGGGGSDYVSGTAVSSIVPVEWKVVAHEVGHNFGAIHDCTSGSCPQSAGSSLCCPCPSTCDCNGQYLMHPTDNAVTSQFSDCSKTAICQTLQDPNRYDCLQPPNALQALTSNICGNGVKEAGEECDCGGPDCGTTDPCCNGATCKLTSGSVCDDLNDDCCTKCQFKTQGAVCRPSTGVCDYAEVCDGKSGSCPTNLFAPNGQTCTSGLAGVTGTTCANGVCTSRNEQCTTNSHGLKTTGVCKLPGSETQCQLLCATANGQCYILAGSMIDGTPCGYAGNCNKGTCEESSWFGKFVDLFLQNLQISVPIAVGVGLLLLGALWSMCGCCYRQYKYGSTGTRRRTHRPSPRALPVSPVVVQDIPLEQYPPYQQQQQSSNNAQRHTPSYHQQSYAVGPSEAVGSHNSFLPSESGRARQQQQHPSSQSNWVDASKYNGDF